MKYPHYLFVITTSSVQQREDGSWQSPTQALVFLCRCREEAQSKGQEVPLANTHVQRGNASFRRFCSVVYFPKGVARLPAGVRILISDDPQGKEVRVEALVQRCDIGQYHARLWV